MTKNALPEVGDFKIQEPVLTEKGPASQHQGCGSGSAFIFAPGSGSAFNMRIHIQARKLSKYKTAITFYYTCFFFTTENSSKNGILHIFLARFGFAFKKQSWIRIRIEKNSWIQICKKLKRIHSSPQHKQKR